ncbi:MAG: hypothetical protein LQ347_002640 [Umbilicaria vellea]|nr:MAG: hypothetical protein LQ347_002640 [Umbilicaria vellea]
MIEPSLRTWYGQATVDTQEKTTSEPEIGGFYPLVLRIPEVMVQATYRNRTLLSVCHHPRDRARKMSDTQDTVKVMEDIQRQRIMEHEGFHAAQRERLSASDTLLGGRLRRFSHEMSTVPDDTITSSQDGEWEDGQREDGLCASMTDETEIA